MILVRNLLHLYSVDNNVSQRVSIFVVVVVIAVVLVCFKFSYFCFVYFLFFLTWFLVCLFFFFSFLLRRLNSNFFRTLPVGAFTGLPNLLVL